MFADALALSPDSPARPSQNVTVTFYDESGIRTELLDRVADCRFEAVRPVRSVASFKGQRNFSGALWVATVGDHVGFESWVERDRLVELDFAADVTGVASQPFQLNLVVGGRAIYKCLSNLRDST